MLSRTLKKVAGAVAAAVTLTIVASVAPSSAVLAQFDGVHDDEVILVADSGWGP